MKLVKCEIANKIHSIQKNKALSIFIGTDEQVNNVGAFVYTFEKGKTSNQITQLNLMEKIDQLYFLDKLQKIRIDEIE